MANSNRSANPVTWAKNSMERVEVRTFAEYRAYVDYVAEKKAAGYYTRTTRVAYNRRKVFVYKKAV